MNQKITPEQIRNLTPEKAYEAVAKSIGAPCATVQIIVPPTEKKNLEMGFRKK